MNLSLAILGLTLHVLIWEKLPEWGSWFNNLLARLPNSLVNLYQAWHCPYCFGFWAALVLQIVTGEMTIAVLISPPAYLGLFAVPIAMFLDALATALLILVGSLLLKALAVPAIKGHQMTLAFKQDQLESNKVKE